MSKKILICAENLLIHTWIPPSSSLCIQLQIFCINFSIFVKTMMQAAWNLAHSFNFSAFHLPIRNKEYCNVTYIVSKQFILDSIYRSMYNFSLLHTFGCFINENIRRTWTRSCMCINTCAVKIELLQLHAVSICSLINKFSTVSQLSSCLGQCKRRWRKQLEKKMGIKFWQWENGIKSYCSNLLYSKCQ